MKHCLFAVAAALLLASSWPGNARAASTLNGTWSILTRYGEVRLEMQWSDGRGSSNSSVHGADVNALGIAGALASSGEHVHFSLHREAGDFAMDGWVGNAQGGGTYAFAPKA